MLQSIEFGFYVLNEKFGRELGNGQTLLTIKPKNTVVIASSVSNGGGSSVRAAEQDTKGLIDGVAVSEPNAACWITPRHLPSIRVVPTRRRRSGTMRH